MILTNGGMLVGAYTCNCSSSFSLFFSFFFEMKWGCSSFFIFSAGGVADGLGWPCSFGSFFLSFLFTYIPIPLDEEEVGRVATCSYVHVYLEGEWAFFFLPEEL